MDHHEEDYREDYLRAYFGPHDEYYYHKLEQIQNGQKFTFNIGAFFFGLLWMLYRKLYVHALLYFGFVFGQGLLLTYVNEHYEMPQTAFLILDRGLMLVWGLAVGFLGNYFYIRQAEAKVNQVEKLGLSPQATVDRLALMGGITYLPHIILLVFVLVGLLFLNVA